MTRPHILDLDNTELESLVEKAMQAEEDLASRDARALGAWFDVETGEVCIRLSRGSRLCAPHHLRWLKRGIGDGLVDDVVSVTMAEANRRLR